MVGRRGTLCRCAGGECDPYPGGEQDYADARREAARLEISPVTRCLPCSGRSCSSGGSRARA